MSSPDAQSRCPQCRHLNRVIARYCGECGVQLIEQPPLTTGMTIGPGGRYQIEARLGSGGFSDALLATDRGLGRPCVVKRLRLQPAWDPDTRSAVLASFAREARLLVSLNTPGHPHIPEIYEYLPADQALVMKYLDGQSLREVLRQQGGRMAEAEALRYARAVCDALVYMHSRPTPVLHRDLKPDNLLLDSTGRLWLIDFGLASTTGGLVSADGSGSPSGGTPGYTPPEQWQGQTGPRSDIYALAATLYELLGGRRPALNGAATPPLHELSPTVRRAAAQLVMRGLAASPAERPDAPAFLAEVAQLLADLELPAPPAPALPPPPAELAGRDDAQHLLQAQIRSAGRAAVVGMPGIGKSALLGTLARAVAAGRPTLWHTFRAGEGVEAALWHLAALLARADQVELWRELHAGQGRPAPPPIDGMVSYLLALLQRGRYLLCFDDLHEADDSPQVQALMRSLWQHAAPDGTAVIIGSRRLPGFLRDGEALALGGLDRAAAQALLHGRAVELPPALIDRLHEATGGNPQLLILAGGLLQRAPDPAALVGRLAASADVERYLLQEVDAGLSAAERDLLGALAVLGSRPASRDLIEALLDGQRPRRELRALVDRRLLSVDADAEEPHYQLHAILRGFYADGLGRAQRGALHRRAAAYYGQIAQAPLPAAEHLLEAGDPAAAAALLTADPWPLINGGQAHALGRLLGRLAGAALDAATLIAVQLARGEVATLLRDGSAARESYRGALALLEAQPAGPEAQRQQIRAYRGMGELLEPEDPQAALEWLRRGQALLGDAHGQEAALLNLRMAAALIATGAYTEAHGALERCLAELPADDTRWRPRALTNLGVVRCSQGEVAQGLAAYQAALAIYQRTGNRWGMIEVWHNLGIELEIAGDWAQAADEYRRALAVADELNRVVAQANITLCLGILESHRGDFAAAEGHLRRCEGLARQHELHEQLVSVLSSLADLALRRGQHAAVAPLLAEAEALAEAADIRYQLPEITRSRALLQIAGDQLPAALESAAQAVALAVEQEAPIEEALGLRVLGEALAQAGRHAEGRAAFARSLELLEGSEPYQAACTRLAWGQAARAAGDHAEAEALTAAARAALAALGADLAAAG